MTQTVELSRENLKKILEMYIDASELLENIPEMQDQGRLSEVSQHIGAELEARVTIMNEAEKQDPVIKDIIQEIRNKETKPELKQLEEDVLGE